MPSIFSKPKLRPVRSTPTPLFQDHKTAFLKTIKLLTQHLKKRSLTEKIRPVMSVLPSHVGIMPVTEKKLLITGFLVTFCFIQN